jgi:glucokinase
MTAREICFRARAGNQRALFAVDRLGKYLGMGIANVVSMLMPETIVLGGSVMQSADLFLNRIREVVRENCRLVPALECEIALSSSGAAAGLMGAAQVWHSRFHR